MISFSFIIISYIIIFALFYSNLTPASPLGYITEENVIKILDYKEALFFSGFIFFSMDYNNLQSQDLLNTIGLLELFIAQIMIIVFIGVLASELLNILKLKNGNVKN